MRCFTLPVNTPPSVQARFTKSVFVLSLSLSLVLARVDDWAHSSGLVEGN